MHCPVEFADLVVNTIIVRFLEREDSGDLLPSSMSEVRSAALEQEHTSLPARRAVQLRMHADGAIDGGELKAWHGDVPGARDRHRGGAGVPPASTPRWRESPGVPTPCRSGRAAPGLGRQVIRAYCQVPPDEFTAGATAEVYDPELITVNLWR
jgi:hypothetical protein